MNTVTVPNRPFASELITGLMLPDGIFESSLGQQRLNAHVTNEGATAASDLDVFVESVSDPRIVVTPRTHHLPGLQGGASRLLSWDVDVSAAPAGAHRISIVVDSPSGNRRTIKKIFVTRVTFDPATRTFGAETPEGRMAVRFHDLVVPEQACCPKPGRVELGHSDNVLADLIRLFRQHEPDFEFCPPGYLLREFDLEITPNPPYNGQYGDLPFQDPWCKLILCIIAVLLLIAAGIAAAFGAGGSTTVTTGTPSTPSPVGPCCGVTASGGSSSYLVAGLVAAAAAAATAAGLSDIRDPIRRGQDHTPPADGELTIAEQLQVAFDYPEPVALGRPFVVAADWRYTRVTTGGSVSHAVSETNQNVHVLREYEIDAPDVVRLDRRGLFVVKGRFLDADGTELKGDQLFVQCFLAGPAGQFRSFVLQDDGVRPDEETSDGVYTGSFRFLGDKPDPRGIWLFYVIAQDVNNARTDLTPEEAAQIIGGIVRTHQLSISFDGGTCPLVADGHVQVV